MTQPTFTPGDRVRVRAKAKGKDHVYAGQVGTFQGVAWPVPYAMVQLDDITLGPRYDGYVYLLMDSIEKEP